MVTITEDYVSFEMAKLLKEKGFDAKCNKCYAYFADDDIRCIDLKYSKSAQLLIEDRYPCITLQRAMKWLREIHELYIEVSLSCDREDKNAKRFDASIFNIQNQRYKKLSNIQGYEQACAAAIKFCLENLDNFIKR